MLATLIQTLAIGEAAGTAKRVRRALIDYAIAGVFLAIGVGFLIGAAYIWVANQFTPFKAALWFGGGFVTLAIIAVIIHRIISGMQARRRAAEARAMQLKTVVGAAAIALLPTLLKGRGGGVLGAIAPLVAMAAYAIYKENAAKNEQDADAD